MPLNSRQQVLTTPPEPDEDEDEDDPEADDAL
jgi:hypothetical protein